MQTLRPLVDGPVWLGEAIVLEGKFYVDGDLTDPTTVFGEVQVDAGDIDQHDYIDASEDPEEDGVWRVSLGIYRFRATSPAVGRCVLSLKGTGAAQGVVQGYFDVRDLFTRE